MTFKHSKNRKMISEDAEVNQPQYLVDDAYVAKVKKLFAARKFASKNPEAYKQAMKYIAQINYYAKSPTKHGGYLIVTPEEFVKERMNPVVKQVDTSTRQDAIDSISQKNQQQADLERLLKITQTIQSIWVKTLTCTPSKREVECEITMSDGTVETKTIDLMPGEVHTQITTDQYKKAVRDQFHLNDLYKAAKRQVQKRAYAYRIGKYGTLNYGNRRIEVNVEDIMLCVLRLLFEDSRIIFYYGPRKLTEDTFAFSRNSLKAQDYADEYVANQTYKREHKEEIARAKAEERAKRREAYLQGKFLMH